MTKKNLFIKTLGMMGLVLASVFGVKAQTLIAHYPFNNTLAPSVGSFGSAVIGTAGSATLGSSSVCTDNVNNNSSPYGLYTPSIATLSTTSFQIDFTINLTSLPTVHNATIFVINGGSRYFGLCMSHSGELKVFCNLGVVFSDVSSGFTLTTGTDYNIQLQYINGSTTLIVNNQSCLSVTLPALDPYDLDRSILLGDNPGFGGVNGAIAGCYSNLKVYNNPTALCKTWTGATSTDWSTASNWSPAAVPSGDNVLIPSSSIVNFPIASNITINSGKILTLQSGANLTVTGVLTNNGILTIQSGATLLQGSTSTYVGSGTETVNVKQVINGGRSTSTGLNGRFWYLGSPVTGANSSVFFRTSRDFATSTYNLLKQRDELTNAWSTIAHGSNVSLTVGQGYYLRASNGTASTSNGSTSLLLTFNGGGLNNHPTSSALTLNLSRNVNIFAGFNLVCNPYPSYLDWDLVGRNQVENTMWYRTATGTTSASMVFETYVSGAAGGIGTNLSGNAATKLIPPMQAFWVRVSSGNTSGTITIDNSMRSHFASFGSSTAGLRSTVNDFNLFLRMNLVQEDKKDQIIVYVNENSTNQYDAFDGEKMMQSDLPQFYTTTSGKKIVINGLSAEDTQQSLPLSMELPTTGDHQFMVEDLEIESGNIWLEDKLEGTFQLLEPGFGYKFFANAGLSNDRFVLHLKLKDLLSPSAPNFESANEMAANHAILYAESAGLVVVKLPATDNVSTDVQIYDAAGRTFFSGTLKSLESKIQLEQAKGIYYVSLTSVNGVEVRKVFID